MIPIIASAIELYFNANTAEIVLIKKSAITAGIESIRLYSPDAAKTERYNIAIPPPDKA